MAAISFPSSPTLNQVFASGTKTWVWNGVVWKSSGSAAVQYYDAVTASTGFFSMPAGNTSQRPALPTVGATRWNTERQVAELWTGNSWYAYTNEYINIAVSIGMST
jgi:hypothetical protein